MQSIKLDKSRQQHQICQREKMIKFPAEKQAGRHLESDELGRTRTYDVDNDDDNDHDYDQGELRGQGGPAPGPPSCPSGACISNNTQWVGWAVLKSDNIGARNINK